MKNPGIIKRIMAWLDHIWAVIKREPRDLQALIEILRVAEKRNLLDPDVLIMIEGALHVSDMQVRDVMVPRIQMIVINAGSEPEDIINTVVESGHSRFPVTGDDANDILGILLAKDLLSYFADSGTDDFDIKDMMRPAVFIPESKRLNILLREFRGSRNHMAIVVDEYGGVSGLATIEDVLEQIVGDIDDEHDPEEAAWIQPQSDGKFIVLALTRIEDFNEFFDVKMSDEEYDTVGGLVMHELGRLPRRGEQIEFGGFRFKVLRGDRRRIHTLEVTRPAVPAAE